MRRVRLPSGRRARIGKGTAIIVLKFTRGLGIDLGRVAVIATAPDMQQHREDIHLDSGGFVRVRCEDCGESRGVAFSCQRRGWCPGCMGSRTVDTAARLAAQVLPRREAVLSTMVFNTAPGPTAPTAFAAAWRPTT